MQAYLKDFKLGTVSFKEYKASTYQEEEALLAEELKENRKETDTTQQRAIAATVAPVYFYHPDHLGSSTFLTDANGIAYQFFLNLPFGETMAQQLPDSYYRSPFKFNGKELDEETGLYYYGARYYDPKVSIWLSVDPLAEKYPSWSPYNYCYQNPVNFIDPTGMEGEGVENDYKLSKNGKLKLIKKDDSKTDRIFSENMKNNITVEKGFIKAKYIQKKAAYFLTNDNKKAKEAYKFFSDNTNVEYSLATFSGATKNNVIMTTYEEGKISNSSVYHNYLKYKSISLLYHSHNHPGEYEVRTGWPAYPSGFNYDLTPNFQEKGDRSFYRALNLIYPKQTPDYFNIYVPSAPNLIIK